MENHKSCHTSPDYATIGGDCSSICTSSRDDYLRNLNKISHKISKPLRRPSFEQTLTHPHLRPPIPPHPQQNLQQPPVYNINKNDFRDVVQKLTGSPAHDRISNPPPIHPPKTQSSRLQRIRPPPLDNVNNRPPSLNCGGDFRFPHNPAMSQLGSGFAPSSPLPPLPSVHGAAESPVTAYMKCLRSSISAVDSSQFHTPASPHAFGCVPTSYPVLSPTPGLASPRWRAH